MRLAKMAVSVALYVASALFAFFVYLYNANQTFRFYTKVVLYYLVIMVICGVTVPLSLPWPGDAGNVDTGARIMQFVNKIFGIKWHIKGVENVPDGACVVIANHQSGLDVMGMMEVWPSLRRCCSMVKKELRYAGPFGLLAMLSGSIFIDRLNSDKARNTVNDAVQYLKEKQIKVWIFPEGTRNRNGAMLPFKKGAFHIAVQGQFQILPIVFSSYSHIYNSKHQVFQTGDVAITILPPVSTTGLGTQDVSELTDTVRSMMLRVLEETSEGVANNVAEEDKKIK